LPFRGLLPGRESPESLGRRVSDQTMRTEKGTDTYVERECGHCFEGEIHAGGPTELSKEPRLSCGGTGRAKAFLYPRPKGFRGEWPPETSAREGAS
jgi:hypothetical protein